MAKTKVRMLVDHADEDGRYPCNTLQVLDEDKAKLFIAAGVADGSKAALAHLEAAAKAADNEGDGK